jgi:subtilisin-like proprotein convertase family protein
MGELPNLDGIKVGVPGDEVANGMWTLTVFDTVAGEQGTLELFTLELTSRFD